MSSQAERRASSGLRDQPGPHNREQPRPYAGARGRQSGDRPADYESRDRRVVGALGVRVVESGVDSTPSHPEPGRARRQRRRVLRGRPRGRRGHCAHTQRSHRTGVLVESGRSPVFSTTVSRGGAAAARWAHNPKVAGSNPAPATTTHRPDQLTLAGSVSLTRPGCRFNRSIHVRSYGDDARFSSERRLPAFHTSVGAGEVLRLGSG